MSKSGLIEKAKNVSLVVLFLSTVLLLYFFWGNITFDEFRSSTTEAAGWAPEAASLMKPERIVINFGDNYTVTPAGDIWRNDTEKDSFVEELGRFGPAENIRVEEISQDQYLQVMKFQSIWAEFNYDIPLADFCDNFNIQKPQSYDVIETVTSIGYSAAQGGNSLFICDGKNDKHYRLVAEEAGNAGNTEFPAFIAFIAAEGYNIYYPAGSQMGVENDTLVPLSVKTNLKGFPFRQDIYSYQNEKISAIAEQFFGRNFDFVRTIMEENGTVIYMYGYGQNVLIVNTDGSIEYKEGQSEDVKDQSFSGSLETAVSFVANHGSWESLSSAGLTPYLKDVIRDPDDKDGRRFIFGLEVNGSRLYYEEGDPFVVDVTSGQVTYYKRHLIEINPEDIEAIETASIEDAFSTANLIAQNYKYIYNILLPSGEVKATANEDEMFDIIAALVKDMKIGYVKPAGEMAAEIRPAWIVSVSDTVIYFDLYDADPIGYSKE
ncbi:MAG TPA: hypothetical protein VN381_11245 [Anaerovoracaceae bacterium]|nr:hypothetical protein [Anaerovoracaceae bacterium]